MAHSGDFRTPVTRQYVDVRPYLRGLTPSQASSVRLPLIEYLPDELQTSIRRFMRAPDKFMSLASQLLKYQFIHRNAKLPWSQVSISRTPRPHARPYWDPPRAWHGDGFEGLEFNVSHQAGIIVLLGCRTPNRPQASDLTRSDDEDDDNPTDPDPQPQSHQLRVGVDVACTKEDRRTPDLTTQAKLDAWVDTFTDMFSSNERQRMKSDPPTCDDASNSVVLGWNWKLDKWQAKTRRFYTCWALKEAYIKMVGEGLLADWLRDLEFVNVIPPKRGQRFTAEQSGLQVLLEGSEITGLMQTTLEGLDNDFIIASMMRGVEEEKTQNGDDWVKVDIDKDIRPCAEGTCSCLD